MQRDTPHIAKATNSNCSDVYQIWTSRLVKHSILCEAAWSCKDGVQLNSYL